MIPKSIAEKIEKAAINYGPGFQLVQHDFIEGAEYGASLVLEQAKELVNALEYYRTSLKGLTVDEDIPAIRALVKWQKFVGSGE